MKALLAAIVISCIPLSVFADLCPATLDATQPGPPPGWGFTHRDKLTQKTVSFTFAMYNSSLDQYGHTTSPNGQRISCQYYDDNDQKFIEITTNATNFPVPATQGTDWKIMGTGASTNGWCMNASGDMPPSMCPWG